MFKIYLILLLLAVTSHCQKKFRVANGESIGKLIGYEVKNDGEFPYMVRVQSIVEGVLENGTEFMKIINCGGSILKLNVVLTAAHCVMLRDPENVSVFAGMLHKEFLYFEEGLQVTGVRRLVTHEQFNRTYMDSDIALLFLDNPLTRSEYVKPLLLPTPWHYVPKVPAVVTGWGFDENGESPEWLQKASLVQFPRKLCQIKTNHTVTEGMMCAIDPNHVWTVCKGDSGGPLVLHNRAIGIISWAVNPVILPNNKTTCNPRSPTIFVNVLHFVPWIKSKMREDALLLGDVPSSKLVL